MPPRLRAKPPPRLSRRELALRPPRLHRRPPQSLPETKPARSAHLPPLRPAPYLTPNDATSPRWRLAARHAHLLKMAAPSPSGPASRRPLQDGGSAPPRRGAGWERGLAAGSGLRRAGSGLTAERGRSGPGGGRHAGAGGGPRGGAPAGAAQRRRSLQQVGPGRRWGRGAESRARAAPQCEERGAAGGRGRAIARVETPRRRERSPQRAGVGSVLGRRKKGARTAAGRGRALTVRGALRTRWGEGEPGARCSSCLSCRARPSERRRRTAGSRAATAHAGTGATWSRAAWIPALRHSALLSPAPSAAAFRGLVTRAPGYLSFKSKATVGDQKSRCP